MSHEIQTIQHGGPVVAGAILAGAAIEWLEVQQIALQSIGFRVGVRFTGSDCETSSRWVIVDVCTGQELASCWVELLEGGGGRLVVDEPELT